MHFSKVDDPHVGVRHTKCVCKTGQDNLIIPTLFITSPAAENLGTNGNMPPAEIAHAAAPHLRQHQPVPAGARQAAHVAVCGVKARRRATCAAVHVADPAAETRLPGWHERPAPCWGGGHTRDANIADRSQSVADSRAATTPTRPNGSDGTPQPTTYDAHLTLHPIHPQQDQSRSLPVTADREAHVDSSEGRQTVLHPAVVNPWLRRRGSHTRLWGRSCRERSSRGQPGAGGASVTVA